MAFFDKLNDIAKSIGDLTNEALESNKLTGAISKERTEINNLLLQVGEYYYDKYKQNVMIDDEIFDCMMSIDNHSKILEDLDKQLEAKKDKEAEAEAEEIQDETANEVTKFCHSCGVKIEGNKKFCSECGTRL